MNVPGMLVRSQFTAPNGTTMPWLGNYVSDHRSPLSERWGGWYVTGKTGAIRHMGNAVVTNGSNPESPVIDQTLHLASLAGRFDTNAYLSEYSDVVALMVFEHQMHMMNLLTRIGWEARVAEWRRGRTAEQIRTSGDDPADAPVPLDAAAREVVDYMLFADEAPLPGAIRGSTRFAERFAAEGPRDSKGRSLRDFDLKRRMFRYRLSYMIYSPQFDALPAAARDAIYARLWTELSKPGRSEIVEILRETKSGLPPYFTPARAR